MQAVIDLRSDTQTKPSPGMREAMANAEVGDEQRREDPTVLALEQRGAAFLGHEEAVYLPTATMANQIALAILGRRGTELIVEETAHIMISELGGAAMHSGLQTRGLPGYRGVLSPRQIRTAVRRPTRSTRRARRSSRWRTRTTARAAASGRSRRCAARSTTARELELAVHLDGARLANAAVASGVPAAAIGGMFDTVTLCLSKGLGAPLGALIAGSAGADGAGAGREAPLRRRDAPGRDRRGGRACTRSSTTSTGSPRTTPARCGSPRAGPSAACPPRPSSSRRTSSSST